MPLATVGMRPLGRAVRLRMARRAALRRWLGQCLACLAIVACMAVAMLA